MEPVRVLLSMVPFPSGPLGWKLDKSAVRWLGYSLMSAKYAKQNGIKDESQCLLLVTKGRKSGEKRTVALTYFNVAGRLLVVGSKGGAPAEANARKGIDSVAAAGQNVPPAAPRAAGGEPVRRAVAAEAPPFFQELRT